MMTLIYILWALLNLAAGFYLFYIWIVAIKLVRHHMGLFPAIILVLGTMTWSCHSNNSPGGGLKPWNFSSQDSTIKNSMAFTDANLQKDGIVTYTLFVNYGKDKKTHLNVPVSASASRLGFSGGTEWEPQYLSVWATTDDTKFAYIVTGLQEWKLLGMTIFGRTKNFSGTISVNK